MSNYSTGANFERQLLKDLRALGYDGCRMASSKGKLAGYDCDVIVSKTSTQGTLEEIGIALLQCKRTRKRK